jgi:hypothetical protein
MNIWRAPTFGLTALALATTVSLCGLPPVGAAGTELAADRVTAAPSAAGSVRSVVIEEYPQGAVAPSLLREAAALMQRRLASLGVRGYSAHVETKVIVIDLPESTSTKDADAIAWAVSQVGHLLFRPVGCLIAPYNPGTVRGSTKAHAKAGLAPTVKAVCSLSRAQQPPYEPADADSHGDTLAQYDTAEDTVVLPDYAGLHYGRYVLGPAEMTGTIVKSATADLNRYDHEWEVDLTFTNAGSTEFNRYAVTHYTCYLEDKANPPFCALQAIELDGVVQSAPAIEAASFSGGATINGATQDPFTKQAAEDLALAINYASLPVRFVGQAIITMAAPAAPLSTYQPLTFWQPASTSDGCGETTVNLADSDGGPNATAEATTVQTMPPICSPSRGVNRRSRPVEPTFPSR